MNLQQCSLLWPDGPRARPRTPGLPAQAAADLDLDPVVRALAGRDRRREAVVRAVLGEVATDPETIAYRQAVMADLLRNGRLREELGAIVPLLGELGRKAEPAGRPEEDWGVLELTRRLSDLWMFVTAVTRLQQALEGAAITSQGLGGLRRALRAETEGESFRALQAELPALRERLKQGECVTIAINLKPSWEPESAAILSIGPRVAGRGLLERLLPGEHGRALTPLRRADPVDLFNANNPLFRDLRALLEATAAPVLGALQHFQGVNAQKLAHLETELAFYLGAAALYERLSRAGLPFCFPEVAPAAERGCRVEGCYSLPLALRMLEDPHPGPRRIVPSDVVFDGRARIWILTGPNRGGKTTFIRAVGVAHLLFAAGLPVPGRAARIAPVDRIITHFVTQEHGTPGEGRLDEEAERLAQVFAEATPQSLILMNEVLAGSTSQIESLALAQDAVRGLCLLGARCIYATHLHDLAAAADRINASVPESDSPVASLVAGIIAPDEPAGPEPLIFYRPGDALPSAPSETQPAAEGGADGEAAEVRPTFHIFPAPPRGLSFASAIARQHGISYPQLRETLRRRGLLPSAVTAAERGRM